MEEVTVDPHSDIVEPLKCDPVFRPLRKVPNHMLLTSVRQQKCPLSCTSSKTLGSIFREMFTFLHIQTPRKLMQAHLASHFLPDFNINSPLKRVHLSNQDIFTVAKLEGFHCSYCCYMCDSKCTIPWSLYLHYMNTHIQSHPNFN